LLFDLGVKKITDFTAHFGRGKMALTPTLWAALFCLLTALGWAEVHKILSKRGFWGPEEVSRKALHVGTGLIFIASWDFFPAQTGSAALEEDAWLPWSGYLAALVPLLLTAKFALVGLRLIRDDALVASVSRGVRTTPTLLIFACLFR
jgi:hypothetical protein